MLQPLRDQDRHVRMVGRRRLVGDIGIQRRGVRPGQSVTPEFLRSSAFTRFSLQTDILGEQGRRLDVGVDRCHIDADVEQVVLHQLAY